MSNDNLGFTRVQDLDTGLQLLEQRVDLLNRNVEETLKELKVVVKDLDKDMAVYEEKQARLMYQIDQLEKSIVALGNTNVKKQDSSDAMVRGVLTALISSVIGYFISKLT